MRRSLFSLATGLAITLTACQPAQVVVTGEIEQQDPTSEAGTMRTVPLATMVVELIPFDRDVVFDSLTQAAETPEPEIPEELREAQVAIQEAQQRWQNLEARWNQLRDTLQTLNEELARYSRGEARYVALYREWEPLDQEYQRVDRQVSQAFEEFSELQAESFEQLEELRIQREDWAEVAFADVTTIFQERMDALGREIVVDTTSADGVTVFEEVPEGEWWVHARWQLPTVELYWNEPIQVAGGEVTEVMLDRASAEERRTL